MYNNADVYQVLKKMTLEEFANILNSYNEMQIQNSEIINNTQEQETKKILYTIDELMEEYPFFTRYNINKAIQKNGLPYFTIGNKRMFSKEEIDKWIDKETKAKKAKTKYEI